MAIRTPSLKVPHQKLIKTPTNPLAWNWFLQYAITVSLKESKLAFAYANW